MVGHDGHRVGAAITLVAVTVSLYASVRVPSPYGGPIPMWFLTPPTLAMLSGLSVSDAIADVGWSRSRLRAARLAWAVAALAGTGLAGGLVGANAGQDRLPELTIVLTGLTFGAATFLGRGSAGLGAACLVVVVVSTQALHDQTPEHVWDRLAVPGQLAAAVVVAACVAAYAVLGPRASRDALIG